MPAIAHPAAAALTLAAAASAVVIPFDQRLITSTEDQVLDVYAIDFDADGDTDLLSGSRVENRVVLYTSDGDTVPAFTTTTIIPSAPGLTSFDVADIDDDGVFDIVTATASDNAVSWYKRTPGPMPEDPPVYTRTIIDTVNTPSRVRVADVDSDGDLDILFAGLVAFGYFENDGADPPAFTRRDVAVASLIPTDFRVADVNGDSDPDIVFCGTNPTRLAWYENDGATPPVFTERVITSTLTSPRSLVVADINRDQTDDIVVVSESAIALAWYESDAMSPPTFTEHIVPESFPSAVAVAVEDLDSNGFADIVIASAAGNTIAWFDSDGAPTPAFTERVVDTTAASSPRDVFVADIDGDSDPDILAATAGNDRVVYYANELAPVRNLTLGATYDTIADALLAARDHDVIAVAAFRFDAEPVLNFAGVGATVRSSRELLQPAAGGYTLADGARLASTLPRRADFAGAITVPLAARAEIAASSTTFLAGALLTLDPLASLVIEAPAVTNNGLFDLLGAALLTDGTLTNPGEIVMIQSTLAAQLITNAGDLRGSGDLFADVQNPGEITISADSLIAGDLTNDGTLTIQSGVLTILGALTNNGTIVGQTSGARGATPDGLFIQGDLSLSAAAALTLPAADTLSLAGDFDAAIDDADRFDLASAHLRFAGLGAPQSLEAMSTDLGADPIGLTRGPGRFPIAALTIGATPATVTLADAHNNDNDPGNLAEAIYVSHLTISQGARLNTNGIRVYYETLSVFGTVDAPSNLIPLGASACDADLSGDHAVGSPDLAILLAQWGGSGVGDLTFDGTVGSADLAILLAAWGPCP